ncbi:MAG: hypothetical protein NTV86_00940 [Planctomycetota bacterium]|nr:hypothetical protein [Planctomycetota bacterium]
MAFQTVPRALLKAAMTNDTCRRRQAMGMIVDRYWTAVYVYLKAKGNREEDAMDLTQGFFCDKLLDEQFIRGFDTAKRFRTYLRSVLDHYVWSKYRIGHSKKRHPATPIVSLDVADHRTRPEPIDKHDPHRSYDFEWVFRRVRAALEATRTALLEIGRKTDWMIFDARVAQPILAGSKPVPVIELCRRHKKANPGTICQVVNRVTDQYGQNLRRIIRQDVSSDAEVDAEIKELMRILSERRAST